MKWLMAALPWVLVAAAQAQPGTSWTYQGSLQSAGQPGTGLHDLRFRLYDAPTGGTQVGVMQCADNVSVAGGVFTIVLDFGAQFSGAARYLEIDVRQNTGLGCGNATGFVTLTSRQPITPTPYTMFASQAATATNAASLNGQPASFYTNATNLTTGTLPDTRLTANVSLLGTAQTFSGAKTFSVAPAFTAAGAPFSITSSTLVTNLNADLLDGQSSGAFALTVHTHDAGAITSGTITDVRLSSNIPRLNAVANFYSAGSFAGPLGIGTAAPTSLLELRAADPQLRLRNVNDTGGGVVLNTFGAMQLGMYNPSAAPWGVVPAAGYRAMLALDNMGRVGSVTNTSAGPAWRNFLDDGSGNASFSGDGAFSGRVTATLSSATGGSLQGTHTGTFNTQYGVFGLSSTTGSSSAVGVRGEARGNSGTGVSGVSTASFGVAFGVAGLCSSTNVQSAGVYGESFAANAVYGYSSSGRAIFGRSDSGTGVYAQTNTGGVALYGVHTASNNRGWFGGLSEGGWAESSSGIGFVALTASGTFALYAERNPGSNPANVNRGWFGGVSEGAWAESDQGNGIVALSRGLNAAAVYCRNDAGGRALFADGVAAVRALDILGGADLAEPFDVSGEPTAGMVLSIDPDAPGRLRISAAAYDTTVAGIISGANGLSPGLVMRAKGNAHADGEHVVAMSGRVWCYADATDAEIRPGDRLTTSDTPGHAQRVVDEARAPGTVIGKAMTPLPRGERGLVLVLVNLQ